MHTAKKWQEMYSEILSEFGYDSKKDMASAHTLDAILNRSDTEKTCDMLDHIIRGKTVLVAGAGPSLDRALDELFAHHANKTAVIAADTALKPMVRRGIIPDIIVSDLDGDIESHKAASECGAVVVVHAHGDNMHLLHHAKEFASCIGTTQNEPVGCLYNFGGFTDGDRAMFLASHFGAGSIIASGMELGAQIGTHSDTAARDATLKVRKMAAGRRLVEGWLVRYTGSRLFTTAGSIRGFDCITYDNAIQMLQSQ